MLKTTKKPNQHQQTKSFKSELESEASKRVKKLNKPTCQQTYESSLTKTKDLKISKIQTGKDRKKMYLDIGCGAGTYEKTGKARGQINCDISKPTKKNTELLCM